MIFPIRVSLLLFIVLIGCNMANAQPKGFNYDESKVPKFDLPDLLVAKDGQAITTQEDWEQVRRPEVVNLFREYVYGVPFVGDVEVEFEIDEIAEVVLGGRATRKQIRIVAKRNGRKHEMGLLIYLPDEVIRPVPVFLALNFHGNHTVTDDPGVFVTRHWVQNSDKFGVKNNQANASMRGTRSSRWPLNYILDQGYGVATMYYGDIDPDFDDGFRNGIHSLFDESELDKASMSSISTWAWGLSKIVDYFETDDDIDLERLILMGHSRLGKTALWAGANDPRFSMVISNNSGCGGAALSRRAFGETVKRINEVFPHWFCHKFNQYSDNENECPVDQHMLMALCAPRPLYIASAEKDLWADPTGEFLSGVNAEPVYRLYEVQGLGTNVQPALDQPVGNRIRYHIRSGGHDVKMFDWERYIEFADRSFQDTK